MYLGTTLRAVAALSSRMAHSANLLQIFSCCVKGKFLNDQLYTSLALEIICCFSKAAEYISHILGIFGNLLKASSNYLFSSPYSLDCTERVEQ